MSVSFRCITSGNIITFQWPVDIETTRDNPAYEEIENEEEVQNTEAEEKVKKTSKRTKKVQ